VYKKEYKTMNGIDYNLLIGKSSILYGESGSGKSVIIKSILYNLKDKVPACIIISPTEKFNKTYDGILPPTFINSNEKITSSQIEYKIRKIVDR